MPRRRIFLWFVYKRIKRGTTSGAYFGCLFGLLLLIIGGLLGALIRAVMGFVLGLINGSVLGLVTLRFFVLPSTQNFYRRFCLLVYPLFNVALRWLFRLLLNRIFPGYSPTDTGVSEFIFYAALLP